LQREAGLVKATALVCHFTAPGGREDPKARKKKSVRKIFPRVPNTIETSQSKVPQQPCGLGGESGR
jgi:hypothetical protein